MYYLTLSVLTIGQIVDIYPNCGLGTSDRVVGGQVSPKGDYGWHVNYWLQN